MTSWHGKAFRITHVMLLAVYTRWIPHKGLLMGNLMFSLWLAWTCCWANIRFASNLIRHDVHINYGTVMFLSPQARELAPEIHLHEWRFSFSPWPWSSASNSRWPTRDQASWETWGLHLCPSRLKWSQNLLFDLYGLWKSWQHRVLSTCDVGVWSFVFTYSNRMTLVVQITCMLWPEYSVIIGSMSLLLMPWLYVSPSHHQPWYRLRSIIETLPSMKYYSCSLGVNKLCKCFMFP